MFREGAQESPKIFNLGMITLGSRREINTHNNFKNSRGIQRLKDVLDCQPFLGYGLSEIVVYVTFTCLNPKR